MSHLYGLDTGPPPVVVMESSRNEMFVGTFLLGLVSISYRDKRSVLFVDSLGTS